MKVTMNVAVSEKTRNRINQVAADLNTSRSALVEKILTDGPGLNVYDQMRKNQMVKCLERPAVSIRKNRQ